MAADRGAAARAVRHDLVALIQQVLVPDLPQDPPHRLDVVVGEGVVRVVHVHPEADALGEALPLLEVGGDALLAQLVELGDAVGLDLPLAVDAEAALDLELHRQAVRVPAGLARHAVAAHRLVAREEVLEDARDDVVRAGLAVGRRRTLVEDVEGRVLTALEALLEDAVVLPELEDARVERREVDARRDVLEPGLTVAHVTRFLLVWAGRPILPDARRGPTGRSAPARVIVPRQRTSGCTSRCTVVLPRVRSTVAPRRTTLRRTRPHRLRTTRSRRHQAIRPTHPGDRQGRRHRRRAQLTTLSYLLSSGVTGSRARAVVEHWPCRTRTSRMPCRWRRPAGTRGYLVTRDGVG